MFKMDGKTYGCTEEGLCLIGGDTDDGVPIIPVIEGPLTDLGSGAFKSLRRAAISGPSVAGAELSVRLDSGPWRKAAPYPGGVFGIGRDGMGRSFQFRIEGDGTPLEITAVDVGVMFHGGRFRG